ncbi:MAG: hypothetical protein AAF750_07570 [Planctomycetota bacterium]
MDVEQINRVIESSRCRVYGLDDVCELGHRAVLACLAEAFDAPQTVILAEPNMPHARTPCVPDLVVLDPDAGTHFIEVKGHTLAGIKDVKPGGKFWLQYDDGVKEADPLAQARRAMFTFKSRYAVLGGDPESLAREAWAVLPRIERAAWRERFGPNAYEPDCLLFADDLQPGWIADRMRAVGQNRLKGSAVHYSPATLNLAMRVFGDHAVVAEVMDRPARSTREGSLGEAFDRQAERLRRLSDEQRSLIRQDWLTGPRLIRGVAGSGKTIVLTAQFAKRLAGRAIERRMREAEGVPPPRLALICNNQTLVPLLRHKVNQAYREITGELPVASQFTVTYINNLYWTMSQAGVWRYRRISEGTDEARVAGYLDELRETELAEPERVERLRYDAIFVDEAQDLLEAEVRLLIRLCRRDDQGQPRLYLAYDDAQNLLGRPRPVWANLGLNLSGRASVMTRCHRSCLEVLEPAFNVLLGRFKAGR